MGAPTRPLAPHKRSRKAAAMSTLIRDSRAADIDGIAAIYQHAVRTGTASFELDPPDRAEMAARRNTVVINGYPYLVAEQNGTVAGYAYASTYRPRPGYRFSVENSVYVAPAFQGHGVGRALLERLVDRCEADGYRLIVAVIGDTANHASIALHRACGFLHVGTLPGVGWKFNQWLDSVMMVRALGLGQTAPAPEGR